MTAIDAYCGQQRQCPSLARSMRTTLRSILGSLPQLWQALFEVRSPLLDSQAEARPPSGYWKLLNVGIVAAANVSMSCAEKLE